MGEHDEENYVIGGDFNTVLDPMLDQFGGIAGSHKNCREQILTIKESFDLADVWRIRNPDLRQYTWYSSSKPCADPENFLRGRVQIPRRGLTENFNHGKN